MPKLEKEKKERKNKKRKKGRIGEEFGHEVYFPGLAKMSTVHEK